MRKLLDKQDNDIQDQEYSGPSATIAALGRGVVQHLVWAFYALVGAGVFAIVFRTFTAGVIENSRAFADTLRTPKPQGFIEGSKNYFGAFVHGLVGTGEGKVHVTVDNPQYEAWASHMEMNKEHGFGHWFITHTVGLLPGVGKYINTQLHRIGKAENGWQKALTNAFTFGGAWGAGGYIGGWAEAALHGSRHGNEGRNQLLRAQQEIKDTRTINDALEKKLVTAEEENIQLKAELGAGKPTLHVAKDAPVMADGDTHEHVSKRNDIKPPEQDWAGDVKAQREESAQHEAVLS